MRLEPNDRVGGYKITRFVRDGSTGALYIAHRIGAPGFTPYSAIKLITPSLFDSPEKSEAFDQEIIRAAKVDDPRIVRLEELGDDRGTRYVAMECVRGFSLFDMLAFYYERDRRIRPGLAVYVALQTALGMQATHEARDGKGNYLKLVHGALTTKKILLTWKGHVKLVRLGMMTATKSLALSSWQRLFRAPEIDGAGDGEAADGRVDVYAIGAILLASLARGGLPVLDGAIDRSAIAESLARAEGIPQAVGDAIAHALEPRRADRPNALAFYRELVDAMPSAAKVTPSDVARELAAIRLDREFGLFAQDRQMVGASYVPPRMTDVPSPFSAPPGKAGEPIERVEVPALPKLPEIVTRDEHTMPTVMPGAPDSAKIVAAPDSDPVVIEPTPSAPIARVSEPPTVAEPTRSAESAQAVEAAKTVEPPKTAPAAPVAEPETPAKAPFPPAAKIAIAFLAGVILTLIFASLRSGGTSTPTAPEPASSTFGRAPGAQLFPSFTPMPISSSLRAIAERGVATASPSATPAPDSDAAAPIASAPGDASTPPSARAAASTTAMTDDEAFTKASAHVLAGDVQAGRTLLEARFASGRATGDERTLLRAICKEQHDAACLGRLEQAR